MMQDEQPAPKMTREQQALFVAREITSYTRTEAERVVLAAQEIPVQLAKLTILSETYNAATARAERERNGEAWKHKEETGRMYEEQAQWFYDRHLLPVWDKDAQKFTDTQPIAELTPE